MWQMNSKQAESLPEWSESFLLTEKNLKSLFAHAADAPTKSNGWASAAHNKILIFSNEASTESVESVGAPFDEIEMKLEKNRQ